MTHNAVKQKILEVCNLIGAPVPVVMAIAGIESNFNPSAKSKSGTYIGIFQLSNGWGGCKGDARYDLEKSIRCLWNGSSNAHYRDRERWRQIDDSWDDFYHYGIHQMGFAGFRDVYRARGKKLSEISESRRKNILANKPSSAEWSDVNDWWNYFETKFYKIYNEHKDIASYIDTGAETRLLLSDSIFNPLLSDKSERPLTALERVLLYGSASIISGGILYFHFKDLKKRKSNYYKYIEGEDNADN